MNFRPPRILLFAVSGWLAAAVMPEMVAAVRPAARPPAAKSGDRTGRMKQRIDALLKSRLDPAPLPATLPNPFQLPPGSAVADPREGPKLDLPAGHKPEAAGPVPPAASGPVIPGNDAEALVYYAAGLKITGTVRLNGLDHLIINQSPYKEGDLILLSTPTSTIYLQVLRITPDELTLGLNQAVLTVKLKY